MNAFFKDYDNLIYTNKFKQLKYELFMKVKVYSTPMCPYCVLAKDFLKEIKADFQDIDVSKDRNAAVEMIKKSGQTGVPVIEIGNEIIVGFDKERIKELLRKK